MNNKQLKINKQHGLGSYDEQLLLFSLVHLILCYVIIKHEEKKCLYIESQLKVKKLKL